MARSSRREAVRSSLTGARRVETDSALVEDAARSRSIVFSWAPPLDSAASRAIWTIGAMPPFAERIDTAVRQIELAAEQKGEHIAMLEARRHVNCYLKRESGVKTFKNRICALTKLSDLYEIADELKAFVSAKENI